MVGVAYVGLKLSPPLFTPFLTHVAGAFFLFFSSESALRAYASRKDLIGARGGSWRQP